MKFIVKLFPEITIKSKSVRIRFIKILTNNIRNILKIIDEEISVIYTWDSVEIFFNENSKRNKICEALTRIPGIHHILEVEEKPFVTLYDIFNIVYSVYSTFLEKKTFCVRVKRRGNHTFSSVEAERYIGGMLNKYIVSANVKLRNQDFIVHIHIKNNVLILIKSRFNGIGGFPIGTQGSVLSLISGGVDSGISSYMLMRRGCCVNFCFFRIGGLDHEIKAKQIAFYLWNRFASSHNVLFFIVDFESIIDEIVEKISDSQMGVVLKRMMLRVASKIAERHEIQSIVTGEALGQVSSQTLHNLHVINTVSDLLILRPLISYDKEQIIKFSREIGIEAFVRNTPEYCSVVSKKPTVKAIKSNIEREESKFDFTVLDIVFKNIRIIKINKIIQEEIKKSFDIEIITSISVKNEIILDIRSTDEHKNKPLSLTGIEIINIPYYNLKSKFSFLSKDKVYLLYCDSGVMSRLQALYLKEEGFNNIKILSHLIK
ncbi:tRNA sulfurtransferase [Candidatus Providencia siddallii]|uniref:tRNA sulfurtransferase n=1 Tax=Candidatus Providencia siddallii TaxID=1715285 RepID=A0A0M6W6V9_9GAMM|nr:tRNA sulfurtransferase [Candidatus Providencia siddallii]